MGAVLISAVRVCLAGVLAGVLAVAVASGLSSELGALEGVTAAALLAKACETGRPR